MIQTWSLDLHSISASPASALSGMWRRLQGPVAAKPTSKRYEAFVALEAEHWTAADPKVLSSNPASVKIFYACLHLYQLEN